MVDIRRILRDAPKASKWNGQTVSRVEHKLDGHRLFVYKDPQGECRAFKRNAWHQNPLPLLVRDPTFKNQISYMANGSLLDGEIVCSDGAPASEVISRMKLGEGFTYRPICVPLWDSMRVYSYAISNEIIYNCGFQTVGWFTWNEKFTKSVLLQMALDGNHEGWVLKEGLWSRWYKLKTQHTVDVVVMNSEPLVSRGEIDENRVGSISVGVYKDGTLTPIGKVGTGFTDDDRIAFKQWNTKVIEVATDGLQAGGRLRWPAFKRTRPDKDPVDCTWESEIEGLPRV